MATPMPAIQPDTTWECGFSRSWASWEWCSRSCCGSGNWGRMGMVWRRSLRPKVLRRWHRLPIFEDCESLGLLGFKSFVVGTMVQTYEGKGFPSSKAAGRDWVVLSPRIGRHPLIFWNLAGANRNAQGLQTIQHKLLMPHLIECGRKRQLDRPTTATGQRT